MPPGNIILTDTDGRITLTLRDFKGQHRVVSRGRSYVPPPQSRASLEEVDESSLEDALAREKTVGRALGRGLSLPRRYVDEILSPGLAEPGAADPVRQGRRSRRSARVIKGLLASLDDPTPSLVETPAGLELMVVQPARGTVVETAPTVSQLMDKAFSDFAGRGRGRGRASEGGPGGQGDRGHDTATRGAERRVEAELSQAEEARERGEELGLEGGCRGPHRPCRSRQRLGETIRGPIVDRFASLPRSSTRQRPPRQRSRRSRR